eukprot:TRINITY_DN10934_c0_g1_i1.p1 TRINITY_DN10934_c0_g1~~TRINITY_DN10934_c0_g1_i1.p1  ORF type:complete len:470 (-),score=43.42 TRINITY_DN10934_c0_g1_i1:75-1433(-)
MDGPLHGQSELHWTSATRAPFSISELEERRKWLATEVEHIRQRGARPTAAAAAPPPPEPRPSQPLPCAAGRTPTPGRRATERSPERHFNAGSATAWTRSRFSECEGDSHMRQSFATGLMETAEPYGRRHPRVVEPQPHETHLQQLQAHVTPHRSPFETSSEIRDALANPSHHASAMLTPRESRHGSPLLRHSSSRPSSVQLHRGRINSYVNGHLSGHKAASALSLDSNQLLDVPLSRGEPSARSRTFENWAQPPSLRFESQDISGTSSSQFSVRIQANQMSRSMSSGGYPASSPGQDRTLKSPATSFGSGGRSARLSHSELLARAKAVEKETAHAIERSRASMEVPERLAFDRRSAFGASHSPPARTGRPSILDSGRPLSAYPGASRIRQDADQMRNGLFASSSNPQVFHASSGYPSLSGAADQIRKSASSHTLRRSDPWCDRRFRDELMCN